MAYIVKTALVVAKAADRSDVYLYRGATVPAHIPAKEVARLVAGDFLEEVKASSKADTQVEIPDGDPDETWKNAQIEAYAKAGGIDLGEATTKADMLAAIAASKA